MNKAYEKYEKQIKAAKASGKNTKANQDKILAAAQRQQAKRGGGRRGEAPLDDAGAVASSAPQRWSDYSVSFHFPEPTELPPPLMQLIDVDFKYPGREDFGLAGVNIGIDMGSRIAIAGPNGAGKTTLMNLLSGASAVHCLLPVDLFPSSSPHILGRSHFPVCYLWVCCCHEQPVSLAGDLEPCVGESRRSHKLRIGRYNQHFVDALAFDENPVEYLLNKFPTEGLKADDMRRMLGRFGLSGHHHLTPIIKLSGASSYVCPE